MEEQKILKIPEKILEKLKHNQTELTNLSN